VAAQSLLNARVDPGRHERTKIVALFAHRALRRFGGLGAVKAVTARDDFAVRLANDGPSGFDGAIAFVGVLVAVGEFRGMVIVVPPWTGAARVRR